MNTCKNLKIYICSSPHGDNDVYYNLLKLIKRQNQIKRLHVVANEEKEAILIHSNSLIDYYNIGAHNLDSLLSNFRNLKSLRHKILMVLNKTLPKNLVSIIFEDQKITIS